MGWFNDYDREYSNSRWDRGWHPNRFGQQSRTFDDAAYRAYPSGNRSYGYAYDYRTPPEQSPTYGRQGDQHVQRWARSHGYDTGFELNPRDRADWESGYGRSGGYGEEFHSRPFRQEGDRYRGRTSGYEVDRFDRDRDLSWEPQTASRNPRAGRRDWASRRNVGW